MKAAKSWRRKGTSGRPDRLAPHCSKVRACLPPRNTNRVAGLATTRSIMQALFDEALRRRRSGRYKNEKPPLQGGSLALERAPTLAKASRVREQEVFGCCFNYKNSKRLYRESTSDAVPRARGTVKEDDFSLQAYALFPVANGAAAEDMLCELDIV
jgi:hypothetical protein